MDELINYEGTGQGCLICPDAMQPPFRSDVEAVTHLAQHTPEELAFALLKENAKVQHFLTAIDQPGGIRTERHAEELLGEVEDTAYRSPARPSTDKPDPTHPRHHPRTLTRLEYTPRDRVRLFGQNEDGEPSNLELTATDVADLITSLEQVRARWRGTGSGPEWWER
ncbi:hypothetical protein [Streptomyces rimosus]|uniref:hypothetical protein n=1 Tax=Streptomyces rimosus TaxID=1927 RepID=UPI0037AD9996